MYLPNTNACIRLMNGFSDVLLEMWRRQPAKNIFIAAIVEAELAFGVDNSHPSERKANALVLNQFLVPYGAVHFDARRARAYGSLRAKLKRSGTPIGPMDMMIAATALAHNLIVVTQNTDEFSKVEGLQFTDWEIVS